MGIADGVPVASGGSSIPGSVPMMPPGTVPVMPTFTPSGRRVHIITDGVTIELPGPPPGAPPGGRWADVAFFGPSSMLCCFAWLLLAPPVACLIPFFPCDRACVYVAPDGTVWDDDGRPS